MKKLLLLVVLFYFSIGLSAQDKRALVMEAANVVSVVPGSGKSILMVTRNFEGYTVDAHGDWAEVPMKISEVEPRVSVRRIMRVEVVGESVLLAVGQIVVELASGGVTSAVLRSTDGGANWRPVSVGSDTLAFADAVRRSQGDHVFFLDGVGRYWSSNDLGLTWTSKKFPKQIIPGAVLEVDMVSSLMGVCVDRLRETHFTVDGWQTLIKPIRVLAEEFPVQPLLSNQVSWSRDLFMWDNHVFLSDGRDVFYSGIDKIRWRRWDTVMCVAMSYDRSGMVYADTRGRLWKSTSFKSEPILLASNISAPSVLNINPIFVSAYSPNSGPQIMREGVFTSHRPYTKAKPITPTEQIITFKTSQWMAQKVSVEAGNVDIYYRELPSGEWHRDTVLPLGSKEIRKHGNDTLLIGAIDYQFAMNIRTRLVTPYRAHKPLASYLKSPTAQFRVLITRDGDDSTRVQWCDYRLQGKVFRCAELVDSSRFGVRSETFFHSIPKETVDKLLADANEDGNKQPSARDISYTQADIDEYKAMLDTIFMYDACLDTLDLYRTPPHAQQHARLIKRDFARVVERIATISDDDLTSALQAWRHWPADLVSSYKIEFKNQSGNQLVMKLERNDEAHPPLLMPWVLTTNSSEWLWYSRSTAEFYRSALPEKIVPPLFVEMGRTPWLFAAVASYYDTMERGRWHRWLSRRVVAEYAD